MSDFESDEKKWRAVAERDSAAAGKFFYAVKTTGIVCRPGCKSRLPKRENVRFFASLEAALEKGFRPCERCRPDALAPEESRARAIEECCRYIETCEEEPTLAALSARVGLSAGRFQREFRQVVGVSPREYWQSLRRDKLQKALGDGRRVGDAIYEAGFGAASRYYERSAAELGMKGGDYRRGGTGERIYHSASVWSLGIVLVARTEIGICAIELGDSEEDSMESLRGRFPNAELVPDVEGAELLRAVVELLEGGNEATTLPLDIRGTAFRQKVWLALREIPRGQTVSYADLATRIGCAGSARAVAGAVAANPLAVVVPCHRVVRSDGGLGGYRWGVGVKRRLLEREGGRKK